MYLCRDDFVGFDIAGAEENPERYKPQMDRVGHTPHICTCTCVCMCMCVYVRVCVHLRVCMCRCMLHIHTCACTGACVCVHLRVCMYRCAYVCMCRCMLHIHTCVCTGVCVCAGACCRVTDYRTRGRRHAHGPARACCYCCYTTTCTYKRTHRRVHTLVVYIHWWCMYTMHFAHKTERERVRRRLLLYIHILHARTHCCCIYIYYTHTHTAVVYAYTTRTHTLLLLLLYIHYHTLCSSLLGRIGHGIQIVRDKKALSLIREKGVLLEIAPYSNWITGGVDELHNHPIRELYVQGVMISVSTDDPGIMDTDINGLKRGGGGGGRGGKVGREDGNASAKEVVVVMWEGRRRGGAVCTATTTAVCVCV